MTEQKLFYSFGKSGTEGAGNMKELLGGKGANLAEMSRIGLPVPPGFTISTEACTIYQQEGKFEDKFWDELKSRLDRVQEDAGKKLGEGPLPLLLSCRSGARISMPGMMDTVLDIGLNDEVVEVLAEGSGKPRFAYDCYRRLIQMFGNVVKGVEDHHFEELLKKARKDAGVESDSEIPAERMKQLCQEYKAAYKEQVGKEFPQDAVEQVKEASLAVFRSWKVPRAIAYRRMNKIPEDWGTAVNVQTMVFGNMGDDSGSGVGFTRNPSTGEKILFGEYLPNAQGEDVVAGIRTPIALDKDQGGDMSLEVRQPEMYKQLEDIQEKLEKHYKDMQDFEFTIEAGTMYMLQTRNGKRTGRAAVKIATDMLDEGLIDQTGAVKLVDPTLFEQVLHPSLAPGQDLQVLGKGLNASPGCAVARIVRSADEAVKEAPNGPVIMVREETDPNDIHGFEAAIGILTRFGGGTSHAAVVARGMGKACVCGAGELRITDEGIRFGDETVKWLDYVTIDGSTGHIYRGEAEVVKGELDDDSKKLLSLADKVRDMQVWTNADRPEDAKLAREFGAQGIGLCRTEHMFFGQERLPIMQDMISKLGSKENRLKCLEKLEKFQEDDFRGILEAMDGLPVVIRLLDPPLHEFATEDSDLHEQNPMLGHRGCRLAITYPEIYLMQVSAIAKAACDLRMAGKDPRPEIMIPLTSNAGELAVLRPQVAERVAEVQKAEGQDFVVPIGTMIEIPRACIVADQLAENADFFSFGTNDLTQMSFGFSRDDVGTFLPEYVERKVLPDDPFQVLDDIGVGFLVRLGVERGRQTKPELKIGICGEHGGEPISIGIGHDAGLNYVSCSPFRVPVARLASAHATLRNPR